MKIKSLLIMLVAGILLSSSQKSSEDAFFSRLINTAILFTADGLVQGDNNVRAFVTDFSTVYGSPTDYKQLFTKEANPKLIYEIGELTTKKGVFSVLFLKQNGSDAKDIELLIIYPKEKGINHSADIDEARTEWMKLCNAHQASELVKQKYTVNAYYYNRGRLLQGTESISAEYSYMNRPAYTLTLTPLHVVSVASTIVYEIGQCSGSYGGPYVLLWEQQANGDWQVLMDTNY